MLDANAKQTTAHAMMFKETRQNALGNAKSYLTELLRNATFVSFTSSFKPVQQPVPEPHSPPSPLAQASAHQTPSALSQCTDGNPHSEP